MLGLTIYWLAKGLEVLGMLMLPAALFYGMTLQGSEAMVVELKLMFAGILLFMLGRGLEATTGQED